MFNRYTGALLSGCLLLTGCVNDPPAFDPLKMQKVQRITEPRPPRPSLKPLPTTLRTPGTETPDDPGPQPRELRMTLQEIVQRAVLNNPETRVAGYAPAIEAARTIEAEARFDPVFFANINFERRERDAALLTNFDSGEQLEFQTGLRQNLPSGAQAELRYETSRFLLPRNTITGTESVATYESELTLQIQQPLLRDFGDEVNRARIAIARNNQQISILDFRTTLEEQLANIEQTYWQLVQAQRNVVILTRLLEESVRTAELVGKRREQDAGPVEIGLVNSTVEDRRANLVRAHSRVKDLSDQLKRQMGDPEIPITSDIVVLPATEPVLQPLHFDLKNQVDTALAWRAELGQQQLRVGNADVAIIVAKNNLLPQLNLVGTIGLQDSDDQWTTSNEMGNFSFSTGFQFEVPIGNRAARAIWQRALLQRQQAIDQYRQTIADVTLQVTLAVREVETAWNELIQRRNATFAAQQSLEAIQKRENAGEQLRYAFLDLKLNAQGRLAQAAQQEAEAVAAYNIAISRLEFRKGTLLRYNNVLLQEDALPISLAGP
jgi:outer membrane protein TolC